MKEEVMEIKKTKRLGKPRATLEIPIKPNTPEWEHLVKAEEHLAKAGVTFDTSFACQENIRDWELDWSLEGAYLNNVREMTDKEQKVKNRVK